jgi:nitrite reductase/ring-hydroxylating ferredoxin subunit
MTTPHTSRRIVFQGLGALGVAAVLAGCGGSEEGGSGNGGDAASDPTSGGSKSADDGASPGGTPAALADVSEVPVGGGLILTGENIVITQPAEGDFKAFGARCKHQGFTVTSVEDNTIKCSHHGSAYDAETGEVSSPPAPTGLDPVAIMVQGTKIFAA